MELTDDGSGSKSICVLVVDSMDKSLLLVLDLSVVSLIGDEAHYRGEAESCHVNIQALVPHRDHAVHEGVDDGPVHKRRLEAGLPLMLESTRTVIASDFEGLLPR